MTKVAAIFILVGLNLYQIAMTSFMVYSKHMFEPGLVIFITWLCTNIFGYWAIGRYFKALKDQDSAEIKRNEVNLEWFRDVYLHPALGYSLNEDDYGDIVTATTTSDSDDDDDDKRIGGDDDEDHHGGCDEDEQQLESSSATSTNNVVRREPSDKSLHFFDDYDNSLSSPSIVPAWSNNRRHSVMLFGSV